MVGSILLVIGIVGVAIFIAFRLFEDSRNVRFFASFRGECDEYVRTTWHAIVVSDAPRSYRSHLFRALRHGVHNILVFLAGLLRSVEGFVSRMSHRMHPHVVRAEDAGDPSPFLKDIRIQKKKDGINEED